MQSKNLSCFCNEIANAVKFVQSTSEVAIAVKFAAGELRDASYYITFFRCFDYAQHDS